MRRSCYASYYACSCIAYTPVFNNTSSGTFVQNDVLTQFVLKGLPFGGAGPSGYG